MGLRSMGFVFGLEIFGNEIILLKLLNLLEIVCIIKFSVYLYITKLNNMKNTSKTTAAETLGMIAFGLGKKCIPAWDNSLMELLEPQMGSKLNVKILKAWSKGWNKANLLNAA